MIHLFENKGVQWVEVRDAENPVRIVMQGRLQRFEMVRHPKGTRTIVEIE